jgi:hypothetical protein
MDGVEVCRESRESDEKAEQTATEKRVGNTEEKIRLRGEV